MRVKATIDRFEGNKTVILIGDEGISATWPRAFLPTGIREGDVLSFSVSVDDKATLADREEADKLLKALTQDKT